MTRKAVFTSMEFATMMGLVASLNPARYKHASSRAVIEKCKDIKENWPDRIQIVDAEL